MNHVIPKIRKIECDRLKQLDNAITILSGAIGGVSAIENFSAIELSKAEGAKLRMMGECERLEIAIAEKPSLETP